MKFPYHVYCNNVSYAPGEEVPIDEPVTEEKLVEEKKEIAPAESEPAAEQQELVEEKQYTKTDINRMQVAELRELAEQNGIDPALSGALIKKALIAKFDL